MTSNDFRFYFGRFRQVVWPSFVEHDGCVFRTDTDPFPISLYQDWFTTLNGARPRIEEVMNHGHIVDLLEGFVSGPDRELVLQVGSFLRDTWTTKLQRDFPDRSFTVCFDESYSEDLLDYQITFFQRAEPIAPHEPPLPVSGLGAPVHPTLDSLPAPGSSGGR